MGYKLDRLRREYERDADDIRRERISRLVEAESRGWTSEARPSRRSRGARFTILSFIVAGSALVAIKVFRPEINIAPAAIMFVSVFAGCAIMSIISRRMR